jgi:hypothetical protein
VGYFPAKRHCPTTKRVGEMRGERWPSILNKKFFSNEHIGPVEMNWDRRPYQKGGNGTHSFEWCNFHAPKKKRWRVTRGLRSKFANFECNSDRKPQK